MPAKQNNTLWLNAFSLVAIVHIMFIVADNVLVTTITKYALMPLLMMHVWTNRKPGMSLRDPLLVALFFSWMGDAFLLYDDRNSLYFILGLASFLLAHITYILAFRRRMDTPQGSSKNIRLLLLLPLIYAVALFSKLASHLDDMLIPVTLYTIVITLMCMFAILRYGRTASYGFWFVLIGAILFILSDSMIAWSSFYAPFNYSALLIMITYIMAQYLLVSGLMLHDADEQTSPSQSGR